MTRDFLIGKIRKCNSLPTLPSVAMKVLDLARRDEVEIHEIAALISNDPALSGKVLRTVNSPFYGLTKTVCTISNALVILGTEAVKTLVLGFSLVNSLQGEGLRGKTQLAYWRRSIYSAVAARLLCQRLGILEREEVFLAALLQDVGVQVLKQVVPTEYDQLLSETAVWGGQLARRERAALELTHCEAGLLLAEMWRLPPMLTAVIGHHHTLKSADPLFFRNCQLVRLANLCAEVFMGHRDNRFVERVRRFARTAFGLNAEACDLLLAEVSGNTQELADLFEINIGEQRPYEEILAEASETLQTLTLQSQMQAKQMKVKAETDPLTNVANRGKLEEKLEEEFARAAKFMRPLSMLFIDADHFKAVNDQRGHAVGDEVLRHLAKLLASSVRPVDTVGRYGGEEFVIVLPEVSVVEAARQADEIRVKIETLSVPVPGESPVSVTASLGVAGFDGVPGPYRVAAHLMQAADRACYAAKSSGRNTVRVFAPKVKKPAQVSPPATGT